jgi:hypothetical protein
MTPARWLLSAVLAGFVGLAPARAQDPKEDVLTRPLEDRRDLTLLRRVSERTFVHEVARVSFTVPEGWTEIPPHRAARRIDRRPSTLLGVEHTGRAGVASLVWTMLDPGARPTDWARDTSVRGEYGEEYETLKAVYGPDRVAVPARVRDGPFEGYRIDIRAGQGGQGPGALFVFAVEAGGTTWLLKARVSSATAEGHAEDVRAVLGGYALLPAGAGVAPRKAAGFDARVPWPADRADDKRSRPPA